MENTWVLGASDPEMSAIEQLLLDETRSKHSDWCAAMCWAGDTYAERLRLPVETAQVLRSGMIEDATQCARSAAYRSAVARDLYRRDSRSKRARALRERLQIASRQGRLAHLRACEADTANAVAYALYLTRLPVSHWCAEAIARYVSHRSGPRHRLMIQFPAGGTSP